MGERIVIVGGGAAGFFAAIACATARPKNDVLILERTSQFLSKVRISGGGRCNVTHTPALEARAFSSRYPRGARALIGALHRFSAENTVAWFQRHGVRLKVEEDGRVFPVTDSSATVIDCLMFEARAAGVQLRTRAGVEAVEHRAGKFELTVGAGDTLTCDRLLLATGGARDRAGAEISRALGHTIEPPVPSLFSLHVTAPWLLALPGVAVPDVEVSVPALKLRERGPLLITHNGVSGPAVLRLSAWGARPLAACDYKCVLRINWVPTATAQSLADEFQAERATHPTRRITNSPPHSLPARLWAQLVDVVGISEATTWTRLTRADGTALIQQLTATQVPVNGKSLNKDEFVTCGGVSLREVNLRTMESRIVPHLYFAGELLDIDGITGGFNFQAAWTTGWLAGHAMADTEPEVK